MREHGDYATNVALQLAKPAGRPPREIAELVAARLARDARHRAGSTSPGRASSTSPSTRRRRASWPRRSSQRGRGVRPHRRRSPGQRINLEFISANPTGPLHLGAHPVGGGRRRDRRGSSSAAGARRSPASTTSTTAACRSTGSARRCAAAAAGRAGPGRRLPRRLHRRPRRADRGRRTPSIVDLPDDERLVAFRESGYELQLAEQQARPRRVRHALRRLVRPSGRCTTSGAVERGAGAAARAGPRLRAGRRRLAAHHRLRRRQGPRADQGRRRADVLRRRHRLLPRQARRAASTCASTCSAPTTTATSAGCGRSRPAPATTRTRTSRS